MGAASDSLADQPIGKDAQGKSVHCFSWARLVGNVALSLALCSCIGLMLYENTSIALNVHFSTRRKEDAAVRSPILLLTSRRCNRIDLPAQLSNSTQGPYNPAAIKSPQTGEWLLFLRIEEVRSGSVRWDIAIAITKLYRHCLLNGDDSAAHAR